MKNKFTLISTKSKAALVLGVLTATAALGMTQSAEAAPYDRAPAWGNRDRVEYRGRNDRRPARRPNRSDRQSFVGRVSNDRGANLFNLWANGTTYNVYTINRTVRRLDEKDLVRVTGRRVGRNDIREARVEILRNR